jgi:hypothetical protein
MSPNSPSMTLMPVALVNGLKACFLKGLGDRLPPQPSKRMDLAAQASLDGVPKGAHQSDGRAGKAEVFEKVTAADFAGLIRLIHPIQFFFRYLGHESPFKVRLEWLSG